MHQIKVIFILCFVLVFSACQSPQEKQVQQAHSLRIISLAPSVTRELQYLGLTDNIVGATSYCDISQESPHLIIGTATEVNLEKIFLLKPDIVFATCLTKETTLNTLKKNGIKIHLVDKLDSFDEICEAFIAIGDEVNRKDSAKEIVKKSQQTIDSLRQLIPTQSKKQKVFIQLGANPLFTVIPNTFMDDYISFSACENIASDLRIGSIGRETVIARNPDVIFIVTMGIVGAQEEDVCKNFKEMNAVKNKRIYVIDSNIACTPSVVSFTKALEDIIHKLYVE
jgi:iron complex transport system substrate-binding protein